MRRLVLALTLLGMCSCDDGPDLEQMRERAQQRAAQEQAPMDPYGVWRIDPGELEAARRTGPTQPVQGALARENDDGTLTWLDPVATVPVRLTLEIADDGWFTLRGSIGKDKVDLDGAVGLDGKYAELFVANRNGQPIDGKMTIVAEIEGDSMRLHLLPWGVWVPMSRT